MLIYLVKWTYNLRSNNIIASIEALRERGTDFLDIPDTYYRELKRHLAHSKVKVKESLDTLQKLKILIDYDDDGYLLQVTILTMVNYCLGFNWNK